MAKFKEAVEIVFAPCENCKKLHIILLNGKGKEFAGVSMDFVSAKEILTDILRDIANIEAGKAIPEGVVQYKEGHGKKH